MRQQQVFASLTEDEIAEIDDIAGRENRSRSQMVAILVRSSLKERARLREKKQRAKQKDHSEHNA